MIAAVDTAGRAEEQILNCNQTDADDGVGCENDDEEPVAMIEESPSGITKFFKSSCGIFLVFQFILSPKVNPNLQDFSPFIISFKSHLSLQI